MADNPYSQFDSDYTPPSNASLANAYTQFDGDWTPPPVESSPNWMSRTLGDMNASENKISDIWQRDMGGDLNPAFAGVQMLGAGAQGALSPIGEGIKSVYNSLPASITDRLNSAASNVATGTENIARIPVNAFENSSYGQKLGDLLMNNPGVMKSAQDVSDTAAAGASIGMVNPAAEGLGKLPGMQDIWADESGSQPILRRAADAINNAITPLSEAGRAKIAGKILAEHAADPQAAIEALKNVPEYIPQSYPTTGPASGDTGLLSLERTLRADPENYFGQRIGEQNAARAATMNAVAGDEGDVAHLIAQRSATTSPLYESAKNVPIAPDAFQPLLSKIDEEVQAAGPKSDLGSTLMAYRAKLTGSMPSMTPVDTGLVDESGSPISRPNFENTQSGPLSQIYREERDQLQKTGLQPGAYASSVKGVVKPLNYQLGQILESQSPDLARANQEFATQSKYINNLQNMQALQDKLTGTTRDMSGNLIYQPSNVERVMKAGVMNTENSGWQPLDQALETNQYHYLGNLQSDLARDNLLNSPQVRPTGSPTYSYTQGARGLNSQLGAALEKIPSWAGGGIIKGVYQGAADKVKAQLIGAMLDPSKAAEMLKNSNP